MTDTAEVERTPPPLAHPTDAISWRPQRDQLARYALVAALMALGVFLVTQLAANADSGISVTLQTTADGTSTDPDAIEVETMTFAEATTAIGELDGPAPAFVLPTSIGGFVAVQLDDVSFQADADDLTLALTGTTDSAFGQTFPAAIEVAVIATWDDGGDDTPRLIVSGQFIDTTLGELIGLDDGSVVADLPVPAGALTVTNRPDGTIPSTDDDLLDPNDLPANGRAFFAHIDGATLRDELPLRGKLNVQSAVDLGALDPAVGDALGIAPGDTVAIDGSIAVDLADFPATGSDAIAGLSLHGALPAATLPTEVVDVLGLDSAGVAFDIGIAVTDSGTPSDPSDDQVRFALDAEIDLGDPFPADGLTLGVDVVRSGTDDVAVTMTASLGEWSQPFGIEWLDLDAVALSATIESAGGAVSADVALEADATLGDKQVLVAVSGNISDTPSAEITIDLLDAITVGDLLAALDLDPGSTIPRHVQDSSVGPASITIDVTSDGGLALDVSANGDIAFFLHDAAIDPVAANVLIDFSIGTETSFSLGVRPNGALRLSDIVADATPDFELIDHASSFGFLFTTSPIEADTIADLSAQRHAFLSPMFADDDAEVAIPAGFSVIGSIELPDEIANLVGDSLGLDSRVQVSGTVPIDPVNNSLDLRLAVSLDRDRTPEWIDSGDLSLTVRAGLTGVEVELGGSITTKFRSGVAPDVAADLAAVGIDVYSDEPVAADFDCPGAAEVAETTTADGVEHRCFDLLTFTATASISASPTSASAELALVLDTAIAGNGDTGWKPFGLEWLTINRTGLVVSLSWNATSPPPGIKVGIGVTGDVIIGEKDLFAAGKIAVTPLPSPPFAKVDLQGFRFATDAGFELDDFFDLQHDIAVTAARIAGDDPATVPAAMTAADLGIPNVALRNIDVSFATKADTTLCIPRGLFVSGDLYLDPTGEPTSRGPKCTPEGTPTPEPPGAGCAANRDNGCVAGVRLAIDESGIAAHGAVNGFDIGPISFDDGVVDLVVNDTEQRFLIHGGVTIEEIGGGELEVSFDSTSSGTSASFAGRLDVGPDAEPFFTGLAEGRVAFDREAIESTGIELRVVLDASNLSIDELGQDFEIAAGEAVDAAAADIIALLDAIQEARTQFRSDPGQFVTDRLAELGITVPAELQPLIDGLADLGAAAGDATESAILRGELLGLPAGGDAKDYHCILPYTYETGGRCYAAEWQGAPLGGVAPISVCPTSELVFQIQGGRCYTTLPQAGVPAGGVAKALSCDLVGSTILHSDDRCYTVPPEGLSIDGVPSGGVASVPTCPVHQPQLYGGRCYTFTPTAGIPAGGNDRVWDPVFSQWGCPVYSPQMYGSRCYTTTPSNGTPSGGSASTVGCEVLTPVLYGNRCYAIPPGDPLPNGLPEGGLDNTGYKCFAPNLEESVVDGRCYVPLLAKTNGIPSGGLAKVPACANILHSIHPDDGRCYSFLPIPPIPDASGVAKTFSCAVGQFEHTNGRCYTVFPIDVPGLCDVAGLDPNCTFDEFVDDFIQPALISAAGYSQELFSDISDVLTEIESAFRLECAEFDLVLNGESQSVDVSVTMTTAGTTKTFEIGWDLARPLDENLADLLDGLLGASDAGCAPIDFTDFADDVFSTDGGELLRAARTTPDTAAMTEGATIVARPLDNDVYGDTAVITDVTITTPSSGLVATIGPDGRTIVFTETGTGGRAPGSSSTYAYTYAVTNASGHPTTGSGTIAVTGTNAAPTPAADTASVDLATNPSVTIDVLANDTDPEDGTVSIIQAVSSDGARGCAIIDGDQIRYTAERCDGAPEFVELAGGQTTTDVFSYSVRDGNGAVSNADVTVTVTGANDAPEITTARPSPRFVDRNELVVVSGRFVDADLGDTHTLTIDWGDGVVDTVAAGAGAFRLEHRYASPGRFEPAVTITDNTGATSAHGVAVMVHSTADIVATDADGDSYDISVDCMDTDPDVHPGATEIPYDGIDNDCVNGDLVDVDGDGVDADRAVGGTPDCDDTNALINPDLAEIPYDGLDNNCDGDSDENNGPVPTTTVTLADGQAADSNADDVRFVVEFTQPVTGFDAADIATAPGSPTATVTVATLDTRTYTVTYTDIVGDGAISFDIATGAAANVHGQDSSGATSPVVDVDRVGAVATIDLAPGQPASTTVTPIRFTVVFDTPTPGFDADDLIVSGVDFESADVTVSGDGTTFEVEFAEVSAVGALTLGIDGARLADAAGNPATTVATADTVTITDVVGPTIDVPSQVTALTLVGESHAIVHYDATATDPASSAGAALHSESAAAALGSFGTEIAVTCSPASGSRFEIGTTTVSCSATDAVGNTSSASFDVLVERDTTPIIGAATDQTHTLASAAAGPLHYELPAPTTAAVGNVTFDCTPAIGTVVGPGTVTVTCVGTDEADGTSTTSFDVVVVAGVPGGPLPATGNSGLPLREAAALMALGLALFTVARRRRPLRVITT